jgi:hypothetical protein
LEGKTADQVSVDNQQMGNAQQLTQNEQVFDGVRRPTTGDQSCRFVIFHCYGGAHSSVTTSGIYLGFLPRDRVPSTAEILKVPHYDGEEAITHGHFRFMGRDQADRAVFVLGKGRLGPHINRLLMIITGIYGCAVNFFTVDTTAHVNLLMCCGGYLSRAQKIVCLGRPVVLLGTKLAYDRFALLASRSETRLRENGAPGLPGPGERLPRRVVFYLCPDGFRYPLLAAGFHAHPGMSDRQALDWARGQSFTGGVGSVLLAGLAGDHQVFLVGAGRDPVIVGRIIRDLRLFLEVPQSDCLVVNPGLKPSYTGYLVARGCLRLGLYRLHRLLEEWLFRKYINACRRESVGVIRRIKEGILD